MQWHIELQSWKAPQESNPSLLTQAYQNKLHWMDVLNKSVQHYTILCSYISFCKLCSYKAIQLFYCQTWYIRFPGTHFPSGTEAKQPCSWRHGPCSFLHFSLCVTLGKHPWKVGISPAYWSEVKNQSWLVALTKKQQSPLTSGECIAVIGPTLRAIKLLMANKCLQPTKTNHGNSSLQVNHRYKIGCARAGYCLNTFRNG